MFGYACQLFIVFIELALQLLLRDIFRDILDRDGEVRGADCLLFHFGLLSSLWILEEEEHQHP